MYAILSKYIECNTIERYVYRLKVRMSIELRCNLYGTKLA